MGYKGNSRFRGKNWWNWEKGAANTYHPTDMYRWNNRFNLSDTGRGARDWISGLSDSGDIVRGADGKDYKLSPVMVKWLKKTLPVYNGGGEVDETTINNALQGTVGGMYKDQGVISALSGHRGVNDEIISGNNGLYQWAQAAMASGDPELQNKGRAVMQAVANSQYIYNQAQPEVTRATRQAIADKKKAVSQWFGNNWWWMVPGAALLLGGIGSLFGGGLAEARQNGTAAVPGQPRTPLPDQWTTSLVSETNGGPA